MTRDREENHAEDAGKPVTTRTRLQIEKRD